MAPRLDGKMIDILVALADVNPQLAVPLRKEFFALYAAPGVNLF